MGEPIPARQCTHALPSCGFGIEVPSSAGLRVHRNLTATVRAAHDAGPARFEPGGCSNSKEIGP